ncbi:MAG: four helix bundle protein [Thermodesulfobacteriota bacterium]|nr:four helix bundle protein [Thermodesulfobacteriota bacterium]
MDLYKGEKKTGDDIAERLLDFSVRIIKLVNALPKTIVGRHIAGQLMRSGTSCGSNYEESRGAESRADFIHKLGIVLKEIKESRFWLRLIYHAKIMKPEQIESLIEECEELAAIIAKSIITAKANR